MWMEKFKLSPLGVILVDQFMPPIAMIMGGMIGKIVSAKIGRVEFMIISFGLFVACIAAIGFIVRGPESDGSFPLVFALYVGRTIFLLSRMPIMQSIIYDVAPPNERARWESLATMRQVSFAGTAVVGGHIIEAYGFGLSILVSVVIVLASMPPLLIPYFALPRFEKTPPEATPASSAKSAQTDLL